MANGTSPLAYTWNVTNWQAGESHGNPAAPLTGWYSFNVSGLEATVGDTAIPRFSAHCQGYADGLPLTSEFAACTPSEGPSDCSVISRVYEAGDSVQCHMAISYLTGKS
ncbi:hypothetical protein SCAR479_05808 [Seiridium cardinale]|uniref:Uncharacterized protein n=1 Tax=Seiridium cardinale TaxID=138064 RepID=A0ABR2XV26_9PEZI